MEKIRLKSIDEVGGKFWVRFTVNNEWFTQSFTRNSRGEFCVTAGSGTVGQKTLDCVVNMLNTVNDAEKELAREKQVLEQLQALASVLRRLDGKPFSQLKKEIMNAGFYYLETLGGIFYVYAKDVSFDAPLVKVFPEEIPTIREKVLEKISQQENAVKKIGKALYYDSWIYAINDILAAQEKLAVARAKLPPSILEIARKHFTELN